jgi:Ta0938
MRLRPDGCVLCGSTWGDHWEEVDGERRFFCCEVCARQLHSLVRGLLEATGWTRLDALDIEGDRRGRVARATRGAEEASFSFVFDDAGGVRRLRRIPATAPP